MGLDLTVRVIGEMTKNQHGHTSWTITDVGNLRNCWDICEYLEIENCSTICINLKKFNEILQEDINEYEKTMLKELLQILEEKYSLCDDEDIVEVHAWW